MRILLYLGTKVVQRRNKYKNKSRSDRSREINFQYIKMSRNRLYDMFFFDASCQPVDNINNIVNT